MTLSSPSRLASGSSTSTTEPMPIQIYNTLSRTKEPFQPIEPPKVGIYLCGPTVYKEAHIGHMVGPVIFDTIKRYLAYSGYDVTWVVNITDVDDKLIAEARRRQIAMAEVAREMTADYVANLEALGVDQIDQMPRATDHMQAIISFIEDLIAGGYAYAVDGDVFFDVAKDAEYGKLSNRSLDSQQGEGGEAAAKKRSAGDFALWKQAKADEPSWDSPWGKGRPGWHIECSAMSREILGRSFDIHGGGLDLIFPHHENEIAQSECCHGQPMVNYWMHNGLMKAASAAGKVGGRSDRQASEPSGETATAETKISRSKGAGGLADLIQRQGGERIRFFLLRTHYRSTIVFSEEGVEEAGSALDGFHRFFERYARITGQSFYDLPAVTQRTAGELPESDHTLLVETKVRRDSFLAKMDDDFNTGAAISDLFELLRALNKFADQQGLEEAAPDAVAEHRSAFERSVATLRELTALLGLFRTAPAAEEGQDDQFVDDLMQLFIKMRADARASKDFALADRIRDELQQLGVTLEDRKGGTSWRREG